MAMKLKSWSSELWHCVAMW